ncbi:Thylakoid ADP,ATP carrier protein, chloroplastic [Monoraphidium neglectum]|uniref:Thylakoid ADP,ATP carrier protein, chloroplastic n=1 Tax=Monoraphidium neglectum TaxID=145388 RepID=A0A0D2K4V9_9CHLO|nr:Thylakoid ADP,ATP carrier protein, chloroplastic [Monoraphidium neglectum]KIZ05503.1 Thylakoid ADP,ATP carrier protein, chloroplastic [Monoraphidium neglectum]|eukprot:XP_013904522.1 Thylakoid ADP,ATP carrier protein, chloroplastic [Monoraphidium neglectum]
MASPAPAPDQQLLQAPAPAASPPVPPPTTAARPRGGAWDGAKMFLAGGSAGAVARTCTAPLDRIKLLFQVQAVPSSGASPSSYTGVLQAAAKIYREEGPLAFWKGNGVNVVRIFPYSAAQLAANDQFKRLLAGGGGELDVPRRLASGAAAGMAATALTHPLDVVRLRLALPGHAYRGAVDAARRMVRAEGPLSLYRGLAPTLVGIAPYAAINFASYDLIKKRLYGGEKPQRAAANLLVGAASGTLAATACYPLDTVRRRMQMRGHAYDGQLHALSTIWRAEGARGFYRGWAANTLKVVPQNAIRMVAYEYLKALLGVQRAKTDT